LSSFAQPRPRRTTGERPAACDRAIAGARIAPRVMRRITKTQLMSNLSGRVALVTGASRGLGRETAIALAAAGAEIALVSRDLNGLEETARTIRTETGQEACVVAADVCSIEDVTRMKSQAESKVGRISILVNAAGVFGPLAPFSQTAPQEWIQTLMVNTVGAYLTCRMLVPGMLATNWGRIVNFSSAASLYTPGDLDSAYSTSKAALNRMTRHLAAELVGNGVTATVIHPGSVKTEMWADIRSQVGALEDGAGVFKAWVDRVDQSGGDPPSKAAALVLELVDPTSVGRNGEFCWPHDALDEPVPSW
jgi:NAD(P)-dependent dehydrogenase (short-subunit alcohol dehydrogenase family)